MAIKNKKKYILNDKEIVALIIYVAEYGENYTSAGMCPIINKKRLFKSKAEGLLGKGIIIEGEDLEEARILTEGFRKARGKLHDKKQD